MSTRAPQVPRKRAQEVRRSAGAPNLRVVRRKSRNLMVRSESRRLVPVAVICGIAALAIVVGVLLEQVVLAQSAFKLARVREELVTEEQRHQDLLLEATRLEGSDRIERYARDVLGMVDANSIGLNYIVADVHVRDPLKTPGRRQSGVSAAGQAAGALMSDRLDP